MNSIDTTTSFWWLILAAGLLLFGLGIWVILRPFESYLSISVVLSICILTTGIFEITFSLLNFRAIDNWGWIMLSGLIDFSIGGYLFLYPLLTMIILPVIIGLWLLFRGIAAISSAIELRSNKFKLWGWLLAGGIVLILLAILILANPVFGVINLVFWTGASLIWAGIFKIIIAMRLYKFKVNRSRSIPVT